MAIKGLKDLHYAVIESEDEEETEYGEVKPLGPAVSLGIQPEINRGNLRADDKVLFSDAEKGPMTITLNTAYLEKKVEADILGKTIHDNGLVTDNVDDDPPYIAIGGRAESGRGGYEYFWIYRVKMSPGEEEKETKQETPEYHTNELEGEAIPRLHDGEEKVKVWDGDNDIDQSVFDAWFEEVIDKDFEGNGSGGGEG